MTIDISFSCQDFVTVDLSKIKESGIKKTNAFLVVHGETKVGKSTLASYIPNSVLVCVENDGADELDHPHKYTKIPDSRTLLKMISGLGKLKEKNIIIDNITFLDSMCKTEVLKSNQIDSLAGLGHGKAYEELESKMDKMINAIKTLKTKHGKNVIVLGHTKLYKNYDVATEDDVSELSVSMIRPRNAEYLTRLANGVFYFTLLKSQVDTKGKKTAGDTIVKKKSTRVIYLNKLAGVVCGSNYKGLTDKLVFRKEGDYKNFWKELDPNIGTGKKPKIKNKK